MNRFFPGHCICSKNCWKWRCGMPESGLDLLVCRGTYEHSTLQPGSTDCGNLSRSGGFYDILLCSCVRGRILDSFSGNIALDMPWKGYAGRHTIGQQPSEPFLG